MANIWEKAILISWGNLYSGLSYLITTVSEKAKIIACCWLKKNPHTYILSVDILSYHQFIKFVNENNKSCPALKCIVFFLVLKLGQG